LRNTGVEEGTRRFLLEWHLAKGDIEELASKQEASTTVWSGTLQPRSALNYVPFVSAPHIRRRKIEGGEIQEGA